MIDDLYLTAEIEEEEPDPLAPFIAEGLITEVLGELKSGKEGTCFVCRANPSTGVSLLAAKVYRSRDRRNFKNDSLYREGTVVLDKRAGRAMQKKTDWGRQVAAGGWTYHEWEVLNTLYAAGASVPRPVRLTDSAMLMEYIGTEEGAAPLLHSITLRPEEVRPLFEQVLSHVELFLRLDLVHGDLSAYNILYQQGRIVIIDFPQAVDPRFNPNALPLLQRDLENVYRYWSRYGVRADPTRIAQHLWGRFLRAEL